MITGGGKHTGKIELPSTRRAVMTRIDTQRLVDVLKATTSKQRIGGMILLSPIEELVE
jgi:hypothetical protein